MRALLLFETEDKIPHHYIKYIRDGIYEFRVNYGNNEFRIFFIYDGDTVVVLFNCFKKKTQKTPDSEIKKAVQLNYSICTALCYYTQSMTASISFSSSLNFSDGCFVFGGSYSTPNVSTQTFFIRCGSFGV